jgi:hypothetical protein
LKPCGICDNCINQKTFEITKTEFDNIAAFILEAVKQRPVSIHNLIHDGRNINKQKLWKVINFLQAEQKASGIKRRQYLSRKLPDKMDKPIIDKIKKGPR